MFWISNSNLTLTYTVDIYSHACHACCQLEACLPFRWPRPRLTSSHPGLEGIEELSLSLPCLPVKPQADLMAAVGSWLTAGRLPCGEGARVWVAWGISSLSVCSNPSRDVLCVSRQLQRVHYVFCTFVFCLSADKAVVHCVRQTAFICVHCAWTCGVYRCAETAPRSRVVKCVCV